MNNKVILDINTIQERFEHGTSRQYITNYLKSLKKYIVNVLTTILLNILLIKEKFGNAFKNQDLKPNSIINIIYTLAEIKL